MFEIAGGVYQLATGQNNAAVGTTYNTPAITPTAGTKILFASIGSQSAALGDNLVRTVSGWTNSFVEQIDICQQSVDYPMQGGAILPDFTADGVASYSTTATYSSSSGGRSALIGSYTTSGAVRPASLVMPPFRP